MTLFGGKSSINNVDAYLIFHLKLRAPSLSDLPYGEYQHFLYTTICRLKDEGMTYTEIAAWVNDNNYLTARGKKFRNAHAHSIVKVRKRVTKRIWTPSRHPNSATGNLFNIC
ncbi:MAG: hypothetical protein P8N18_05180 [Hellea sp.]|nr:hypothetical protein [Hellea sp.]